MWPWWPAGRRRAAPAAVRPVAAVAVAMALVMAVAVALAGAGCTGPAPAGPGGAGAPGDAAPAEQAPAELAPPAARPGFVAAGSGRFWLNGKPWRFVGNNVYYLGLRQTPDESLVSTILEANRRRGVQVIRTWAFWEGDSRAYQPRLGEFNAAAYERLDLVLQEAGRAGIRLILVLANNWQDYGGMDKYVQWAGAGRHEDFYTDPEIQAAYRAHIRQLVTRVNSLTGVPYRDDPTILAWELANEPRAQADRTGETIWRWASETSAYIKSLDPDHLVAIGDEGWFRRPGSPDWAYSGNEGVDWERNLGISTVDFATFHLWIEHWKKDLDWSEQWINDHVAAARQAGRPVVMEEYGFFGKQPERDVAFARWYAVAEAGAIDGTLAWMMVEKDHDDGHPGFTHLGPTAELLAAHSARVQAAVAEGK